jgi:hypothetical protein
MNLDNIYIDRIFNKNKNITVFKDKQRIDVITKKKDGSFFNKTILFESTNKEKLEHVEELHQETENKQIIKSIDGKYFFVTKQKKDTKEKRMTIYYFNKDNLFLEFKSFYFNDVDWEGVEKHIPSIAHNGNLIHSIYIVDLYLYMKNPFYKEEGIYTWEDEKMVEIKSNIAFKLEDNDRIEDFLGDFRDKVWGI